MTDNKTLIQQVRKEMSPTKEVSGRTYYTCVRYPNNEVGTYQGMGAIGTPLTVYGPGQWYCIKGWFETYDGTYRGNWVDQKVLNYCKYRNTIDALKKDLGTDFVMIVEKK